MLDSFVTSWTVAARLLCPWDFPGKNNEVGCYFPLQRIFLIQGLNPRLLFGRWILYPWATWEAQSSSLVAVVQSPSCVGLFATSGTAACRPPCPSPSPGVCPSSCSLRWWCCPAISFSDSLFSFCPQSFPASASLSYQWQTKRKKRLEKRKWKRTGVGEGE